MTKINKTQVGATSLNQCKEKNMKALIIAAGIIAVGATSATAQNNPWARGQYPYAQRHHNVCQNKAQRLHAFENRASADRQVTFQERRTIRALQRDLNSTCGRYRWHA